MIFAITAPERITTPRIAKILPMPRILSWMTDSRDIPDRIPKKSAPPIRVKKGGVLYRIATAVIRRMVTRKMSRVYICFCE
jgi:hypothetical protein